MTSRRTFLQALIGVPLAAVVAPEIIWQTARAAVRVPGLSIDEINTITLREIYPSMVWDFSAANPLVAYLRSQHVVSMQGEPIQAPFIYVPMP